MCNVHVLCNTCACDLKERQPSAHGPQLTGQNKETGTQCSSAARNHLRSPLPPTKPRKNSEWNLKISNHYLKHLRALSNTSYLQVLKCISAIFF